MYNWFFMLKYVLSRSFHVRIQVHVALRICLLHGIYKYPPVILCSTDITDAAHFPVALSSVLYHQNNGIFEFCSQNHKKKSYYTRS